MFNKNLTVKSEVHPEEQKLLIHIYSRRVDLLLNYTKLSSCIFRGGKFENSCVWADCKH